MNKKIILVFIFLAFLSPAAFSFEINSLGQGGRIAALGGSGSAWPGNSYGNFLNPAGLAGQTFPNLSTVYFDLAGESNFKEINFNLPVEFGVFSLSYIQSATDGIYQTVLDENGRPEITNSFSYDNSLFAVGLAKNFGNFTAGVTGRFNKQTLGSLGEAKGYNLDAGIIYPLGQSQSLGLVVKNILPGNWGALKWSTGTAEKPPLRVVLGYYQEFTGIKIFADGNFSRAEPFNFKAGAELQAVKALAFRAGVEQVTGYGQVVSARLTVGLGINLGLFDFDYAYLPDPFNAGNSGHYFSLSFRLENLNEKPPEKPASNQPILPAEPKKPRGLPASPFASPL